MSKSRTPIKKPFGEDTNNPTLDVSTTGSTRPHDSTTLTHSNLPSRTEPPSAFNPSYPPSTAPPVPSLHPTPICGTIRKADTDLEEEEPMAKRMRRASLEPPSSQERHHHHHRGDSRSSPSSDSQSGMADTEVDQKKTGESLSSVGSTTQKKKRTRTLTTPHQAAVLHALLAQSRFPTTAMREEVGRAIGLSARKVQIWFQNQRQKARRPRSQGDAPTSRPPQYGPFPSSGMGVYSPSTHVRLPTTPSPYIVAGPSRLRSPDLTRDERYYHSAPLPRDAPPTPLTEGDTPRLLGPGMPGFQSSRHRHSHSYGRDPPSSAPPTESYFSSEPLRRFTSPSSSTTSPLMQPTLMLRPVTSQALHRREWDPSRTLPPLVRSRPSTSSYPFSHRGTHSSYHSRPGSPVPVMPPIQPQRSTSPERRFAHQLPDLHTGQAAASVTLPPPFTLQPAPQWNPLTYGASAHASPEAWPSSRPSSARSAHHPGSSSASASHLPPSASLSGRQGSFHGPEHDSSTGVAQIRNGLGGGPGKTPPPASPPMGSGLPAVGDGSPPLPALTRLGRYDPIREMFVPFTSPVTATTAAATQTRDRSSDDKNHTSDEP